MKFRMIYEANFLILCEYRGMAVPAHGRSHKYSYTITLGYSYYLS